MPGFYRNAIIQAGSFRKAAKALNMPASTLQNRLAIEEGRDGNVRAPQASRYALPRPGQVKRYIITSAQNNTSVFDAGFENLLAYADHIDAEMIIGATTYRIIDRTASGQKTGRETAAEYAEWWDASVERYFVNERVELAPGLVWCGELNILPTAVDPISGLESYTGAASAIYPHNKFAVRSVAAPKGKDAKLIFTTGAVTLRNYIQKKSGQKAEFHHGYGGLVVEVCSDGTWFVRQLNADSEGTIYDLDVCIKGAKVSCGHRPVAVVWGDIHVRQLEDSQRDLHWGKGGILDTLRPQTQVMHDVLDFRSQNHHDRNDPWKRYEKHVEGGSDVAFEVEEAASFLSHAIRDWCNTVIVRSNHDEALVRWLKEGDWKADPQNARFFLTANLVQLSAIHGGDDDFDIIAWSIEDVSVHPLKVRFLRRDEEFLVCPDAGGGIELGMHGDQGPNGTRGSVQQFAKMGRKCIVGHSHSAALTDGAMQVGVTASLEQGYNVGPSSWSHTHALVYPNGKRTLFTVRNGRFRGE